VNILTFDIEEWFHILDNDSTRTEREWSGYESRLERNVDRILELLLEKQLKATFFCLGWVAREYPNVVRQIALQGHELACHSDRHQLVYEQDRSLFVDDLKKAIFSIEDVTGEKIIAYRAPGFSIVPETRWAFEELYKNGISIDCSVFPAPRAHGGYNSYGYAGPSVIDVDGLKLKEFPINLVNILGKQLIFSGGGYFRLIPYWLLKCFMRRSWYVMTYFHPRDFDSNQPVIQDLSLIRQFKSYYGLDSAFDKLEQLIEDFSFVDLRTAESMVDWEAVPEIKL